MTNSKAPFYVGYLPLPEGLQSAVRGWAVGLFALGAALVAGLAWFQSDPGSGSVDWSGGATAEGVLHVDPYPVLYRSRTGERPEATLLVGELKFGAAERATPLDGQHVTATGVPIARDGRRMVELASDETGLVESPGEVPGTERVVLGEHTLVGEIADSKCFLGVMKPGLGKTHRACAVRCISGGIPPILITESEEGEVQMFVLRGRDGRAMNEVVLPYVAEPVRLTGEVSRRGDLLFLDLEPGEIERL